MNRKIKGFEELGNITEEVNQRVASQRAKELRTKYPKINEWIQKDAVVRNWFETYIRSDKDISGGLMSLAELLFSERNIYFNELLKLHQTK